MFLPKRFSKMLFVIMLAILMAGFGAQLISNAADHGDHPDIMDGNLDINDIYVFSQGDNLVLVMTVNPLLSPRVRWRYH